MVMFKIPQRVSRIFLFSIVLAGVAFGLTIDSGTKPELASAGGAETPATCSISASKSSSNPMSYTFRMTINASEAVRGTARAGHPGGSRVFPPIIANWDQNYSVTYSTPGNKTVTGQYHYVRQGSNTVIEVQCSYTVTVTAPPRPKCTDPFAMNYLGEPPCEYRRGCTNPVARNYDPWATIDDGSCIIPGCTNPLKPNFTIIMITGDT